MKIFLKNKLLISYVRKLICVKGLNLNLNNKIFNKKYKRIIKIMKIKKILMAKTKLITKLIHKKIYYLIMIRIKIKKIKFNNKKLMKAN